MIYATIPYHSHSLPGFRNNALILPGPYIVQGTVEVAFGALEARVWFIFVGLEIGMDELDEAVEVFGCDGFVLLVEVVDVAV